MTPAQISMQKHRKYEKQSNMTPPKANNTTLTNTKDNRRKKVQRTQKHNYKKDQQNERGHI
jgi:hypothetical protein